MVEVGQEMRGSMEHRRVEEIMFKIARLILQSYLKHYSSVIVDMSN